MGNKESNIKPNRVGNSNSNGVVKVTSRGRTELTPKTSRDLIRVEDVENITSSTTSTSKISRRSINKDDSFTNNNNNNQRPVVTKGIYITKTCLLGVYNSNFLR